MHRNRPPSTSVTHKFGLCFIIPFSLLSRISFAWTATAKSVFQFPSSTSALHTMSAGRVMVVGSANQDLVSYTGRIPSMGETVMGLDFQTSAGGKGANQAVAAASLCIAPVTMVCKVGNDAFGESLLRNFQRVGVDYDTEACTTKEAHTGVAPIIVSTVTGDNCIIVIPGANHVLTKDEVRTAIESKKPSVVICQLEILPDVALEAMKAGKDVGAITILNPAPAPQGWTLEEFYSFVDILTPNESELRNLCGGGDDEEAMARKLLAKGIGQAVVVTLGSRGALIVTKEESLLVQQPSDLPCKNDPVIDTIGAGDSFCGALSCYLSAGLDLADASTKACGVASMTVRKRGAQSSYPTANELPDCLKIKNMTVSNSKPKITFVTGNKKKLEEVRRILSSSGDFPFEITSQKIDLPELQGDTLEIAIEKCKLAAKQVGGPVLTEDTSLCFNALNGLPGPYIKWFLEKCGHSGLNSMLGGFDDKTAYAQTVFGFSTGPDADVHIFDGRTAGQIVQARGDLAFGWDPVFEPFEGGGKTYGEMSNDEKNSISHRARSMAKLQSYLTDNVENIKSVI